MIEATIIIPCRNEEQFISKCLDSLVRQDYRSTKMEILVVDGMSTDGTREIVNQYAARRPNIVLLDNPAHTAPHALNIGIAAAQGDFIVRIDAHSVYEKEYVRTCIELLKAGKADNVGGCQRAVGTDYWSNAIAFATSTPFGVGNAYFRFSEKERYVDTVYLGAWKKETLLKLGGFDEAWTVNQDYELNYRLRAAGGRVLLSPRVRCAYYVRPSLVRFIRQYFRYGKGKVKTLKRHPGSFTWRQAIPPLFVLGLALSVVVALYQPLAGSVVPAAYGAASSAAALLAAARKGMRYFPAIVIAFLCMHLAWGAGFWYGIGSSLRAA